ncbi:MAG: hypothetical protein DPW14_04585 [Planctomycetes bacterium]|nr:hypothetical protein [Planctomycetota bacterium]
MEAASCKTDKRALRRAPGVMAASLAGAAGTGSEGAASAGAAGAAMRMGKGSLRGKSESAA